MTKKSLLDCTSKSTLFDHLIAETTAILVVFGYCLQATNPWPKRHFWHHFDASQNEPKSDFFGQIFSDLAKNLHYQAIPGQDL